MAITPALYGTGSAAATTTDAIKIIFGDCRNMKEVDDESVHLVVTSPPYYNAPFDYPNLFNSYDEYLNLLRGLAKELKRVLANGRVACFVVQDVRINSILYPIPSDLVTIMIKEGFSYRDKIIWRKPEGYIRISRRSGVLVQHPYPMYFYPDNIHEEILIFQKGRFDYSILQRNRGRGGGREKKKGEKGEEAAVTADVLEASKININEFNRGKWNLSVWDITNVLPHKSRIEQDIAAFPEEIPRRLIRLFSFVGETVLDPFLGSGTTMKVALELGRRCIGYEIDNRLEQIIMKRLQDISKQVSNK